MQKYLKNFHITTKNLKNVKVSMNMEISKNFFTKTSFSVEPSSKVSLNILIISKKLKFILSEYVIFNVRLGYQAAQSFGVKESMLKLSVFNTR